jgi:hypothetical protein
MNECHQLITQCQHVNEKTKGKVVEGRGFAYVSCNGGEGIWNYIVGYNSFLAMGTTNKVSPCKI